MKIQNILLCIGLAQVCCHTANAVDANTIAADLVSLNETFEKTNLETIYTVILEQYPSVQEELFKDKPERLESLRRKSAEKEVGAEYVRLLAGGGRFAFGRIRTFVDGGAQPIKVAQAIIDTGSTSRSWLYSSKNLATYLEVGPKLILNVKEEKKSAVSIPKFDQPWGAVAGWIEDAFGSLIKAPGDASHWKLEAGPDHDTFVATAEKSGWIHKHTLKREAGVYVPIVIEGYATDLRTRSRTDIKYQSVLIDGKQLPFPKESVVTKELHRGDKFLPYIVTRRLVERVSTVPEEAMTTWMTLENPPNLSKEDLLKMSQLK